MATVSPLTFHPDPKNVSGPRDRFGRGMNYLRISLTDRCNFRCMYCMPAAGMVFQPRDEMLTDDELIRLVGFVREGGRHQAAPDWGRADRAAAPDGADSCVQVVPGHR